MSPSTTTRKLAAIMFTDMVGYTALMQEDESTATRLRVRHREVLDEQVEKHFGTTLQYFGDGTLTVFDSAIEAVHCAIDVQHNLQTEPAVPLRIGLSLGDVIYNDEGIFGDGVNLASRIESISVPGAVLISEKVFVELRNQKDIKCELLGGFKFKNVSKRVDVYAIANEGLTIPSRADMRGKLDAAPESSIAILPLANLSDDPENDCFCDGVADEIINTLASIDGIAVISRTSSFRFKDSQDDPQTIGRTLGVSTILEGSVRTDGRSVRISVSLINTADGYQVWSETYDRTLTNILDLQVEIAKNILDRLQVDFGEAVSPAPHIPAPTTNSDAYNHFLKGKYYSNRWTPTDALKAIESFQAALDLDPEFSEPFCSMSNCYTYLGSCGQLQPIVAFSKAQECILASIEKDGTNAESHHAMAMLKFMYNWDWKGADVSFKKALGLKLDSAAFHQTYALYLAAVGRVEDAMEHMTRASRLDPLSLAIVTHLGELNLFLERYDQALRLFDGVLEMDANYRAALQGRGVSLFLLGRTDECLEPLLEYHRLTRDRLRGITVLGLLLGLVGEEDRARKHVELLGERQQLNPDQVLHIDFAIVLIGLGEHEKALEHLREACKNRIGVGCLGMIFIFRCPVFRDLQAHPGFRDIEQLTGLSLTPSTADVSTT